MSAPTTPEAGGMAGSLARAFVDSKLTPLLVLASILLGLLATIMLPREEEPQISVPMIDVMVAMPGATAKEVERRVTTPMERLISELPGVEYVYSISEPGRSLVIARHQVGSRLETAVTRLEHQLSSNLDRIPPGVGQPLIKARTIDDVPILALTLHSDQLDHYQLRRLAEEVFEELKRVDQVAAATITGGLRRQVRVSLDPARLAARNLAPLDLLPALRAANQQYDAGALAVADDSVLIATGGFFREVDEVAAAVVGVHAGIPVTLADVATISDGPAEPDQYVFHRLAGEERPAVTISIAKEPGSNAITVADRVLEHLASLQGRLVPDEVAITTTRNYGATAKEKSDELLLHMVIAVVSVSLLILLMLGWRESLIVAIAIPATLALTLLVFWLYGYTLNRITLFALIFSIGILVDDAIVVVENVVRHRALPGGEQRSLAEIAVAATAEVGNPTILATLAVIAAILPMASVGGLMGPYMRPIPVGASAAMVFSLFVAFIVTPWAAARILRRHASHHGGHDGMPDDWSTRLYKSVMGALVGRAGWRWGFLILITGALIGAVALVPLRKVEVKMLPFDNKSEFQVVVTMPESSTLERTASVARELADELERVPEVTDLQIYAGAPAPFNFNGLVRHYFLRDRANQADIQVNLTSRHHRSRQSHDIAKAVRPALAAIAARNNARLAVAEVPPGPPVLQTLVAEIYGPDDEHRLALARSVRDIFRASEGVVDIDWYVEEGQSRQRFVIDKEKAALHGLDAASIAATLSLAVNGTPAGLLHVDDEADDIDIVLDLDRAHRADPRQLLDLHLAGRAPAVRDRAEAPPLVPLAEIVTIVEEEAGTPIHHKNLVPVTYVVGDVAGTVESPVYAILAMNQALAQLDGRDFGGTRAGIAILNAAMPSDTSEPAIKWDGEWQITIEVFRDLGLAFVAVLVLIYLLMVGWFRSFVTPLVVMIAIPFSLVGILPAHWAMGAFFTATSMIGFMAGAGIVVRNSIILVDFIELRLRSGVGLEEAVVEAGAIRFRPMLLTAAAVVVGAGVILFDPIFQGLAISLIFGEVASLLISRMAVPVLYHAIARRRPARLAVAMT